jgi:hypothetical protein
LEFIAREEFTRQPKENQKILFEYWKLNLSIGDLLLDGNDDISIISNEEDIKLIKEEKCVTPLFTEGQLRKFIEEQAEAYVEIRTFKEGRVLYIVSELMGECEKQFENLLEAYWQLAITTAYMLRIMEED